MIFHLKRDQLLVSEGRPMLRMEGRILVVSWQPGRCDDEEYREPSRVLLKIRNANHSTTAGAVVCKEIIDVVPLILLER